MKTIWKLQPGGRLGQESREEKLKAGYEYIERMKQEFDVTVTEHKDYLEIEYEPTGNTSTTDKG